MSPKGVSYRKGLRDNHDNNAIAWCNATISMQWLGFARPHRVVIQIRMKTLQNSHTTAQRHTRLIRSEQIRLSGLADDD